MAIPSVTTSYTTLPNSIRIFTRTAGPTNGSNILLLHGFPSSSHQFRNLIPLLASAGYRVTAPNLPGFGFSEVPAGLDFEYTFANLTATIPSFLDVVGVKEFAVTGNSYIEGLLPFWEPLKLLWAATPGSDEEQALRKAIDDGFLNLEATKGQYTGGEPHPELINPASWTLDAALLERPGNKEIQLDLFKDYATNVELYPEFQEQLRRSQVPLLAVWGKNDVIFGNLEAFKKDLPNAEVELWDGGHFLSETQTEKIAERILVFLKELIW